MLSVLLRDPDFLFYYAGIMKRRTFLTTASAAGLAMGLPVLGRHALANPLAGGQLKFIFVFNGGGYDPTRVFATEHDNATVDMEIYSEPASAGGIDFVAHASRPSVSEFFESHHDRCLVLNGLLVRSIAHEICTLIAMTGSPSGQMSDWPATLASDRHTDFILPHLVLSGPSFPGPLGSSVARSGGNGQLDQLLSGDILAWSDLPVTGPTHPLEAAMDRYLVRRAAARADGAKSLVDAALSADFRDSFGQAQDLKGLRYVMEFSVGASLDDQASIAVDALALGVSRCVTVMGEGNWDTHTDNDDGQSPLWEDLFGGLGQLVQRLKNVPGEVGDTLLDETCIVVMSEMGRTPGLNVFSGKDHWPCTSAMLIGAGFTGDRVVGGFDENYFGMKLDNATGELHDEGSVLSAESLGATLLAMADIDPGEFVQGAAPITGVIG